MTVVLTVLVLLVMGATTRAWSHAIEPSGGDDFLPGLLVLMMLAGLILGYVRGVERSWRKAGIGRAPRRHEVMFFAAGAAVLILALASPLDAAAEDLLTFHMVQHLLLVAIAPPLLLLGRADMALARTLPRSATGRAVGIVARRAKDAITRPLIAISTHAAVVWCWHVPIAYDAALSNPWLHVLEHISFVATSIPVWIVIVRSWRDRQLAAWGFVAAFLTMLQGSLLSTLLTFSPRPLYGWYLDRAPHWGLSALEDQQLAGLLMGAPAALPYLAAALITAHRALRTSPSSHHRR